MVGRRTLLELDALRGGEALAKLRPFLELVGVEGERRGGRGKRQLARGSHRRERHAAVQRLVLRRVAPRRAPRGRRRHPSAGCRTALDRRRRRGGARRRPAAREGGRPARAILPRKASSTPSHTGHSNDPARGVPPSQELPSPPRVRRKPVRASDAASSAHASRPTSSHSVRSSSSVARCVVGSAATGCQAGSAVSSSRGRAPHGIVGGAAQRLHLLRGPRGAAEQLPEERPPVVPGAHPFQTTSMWRSSPEAAEHPPPPRSRCALRAKGAPTSRRAPCAARAARFRGSRRRRAARPATRVTSRAAARCSSRGTRSSRSAPSSRK